MPTYNDFVFDEIRTIGRAWRAKNPDSFPAELPDGVVEHLFEKIGEMSWRRLVGEATMTTGGKSMRTILQEIGVNPDVYLPPEPPVGPGLFPAESGRLHIDGEHFRTESNQLWQWRGYSWFLGYRDFLRGKDIVPDLLWLRSVGVNLVRVFGPLNWIETPDYTYQNFTTTRLGEFFDILAAYGLRVEFVPICYAFDLKIQRTLVQQIYDIAASRWNVLIEVANEPHVNKTDPVTIIDGGSRLLDKVDRRGILTSYGIYQPYYTSANDPLPTLDYVTIHTTRDAAWHRKARHAQELQHLINKPCISDEPAKITEPGFDYPGGKNDPVMTPHEASWHFGICALWTAGGTVHTEEGKWGRIPTPGMLQHRVMEAVRDNVWLHIDPTWQSGKYNGSHSSSSPVDDVEIGGQPVWTYSSLHDNRALSVRCALSEPKPRNNWLVAEKWGPSNSFVRLVR